jgi:hypothetical protein
MIEKRYLIVAVDLPNFFDGSWADGKREPWRTGRESVLSKVDHQAQKWEERRGERCMLLDELSRRLPPGEDDVDVARLTGETIEMEKWMWSERKPWNESRT